MKKDLTEGDTSLVTAKLPMAGSTVATLFFTKGAQAGKDVPIIQDPFFIGRSKNNHLILADRSVSRRHAVINILDGKYVISDLDSLKGTCVNGEKMREAVLAPGDIIIIGENQMRFRYVGERSGPKKGRGLLYILIVIILAAAIGGSAWYIAERYRARQIPEAVEMGIKTHYQSGIDYFNKDRDVGKARAEWKKILELDPEMKTIFAVKAAKLLKNTEQENPPE